MSSALGLGFGDFRQSIQRGTRDTRAPTGEVI